MNNMHLRLVLMAASLRGIQRRTRCWRAAACLLLCACALGHAAACPLQAPKARFTDLAGLPGLHADAIAGRLAKSQHASGHQLFVLVVPSLDGRSIEECAVAMFQKWKIGRKGVDDGVLLMLAVKERKMRLEVGYGLEGVLTDAQSSRIIHEVMQPLFARGEFAEGIDQGVSAITKVIESGTSEPRDDAQRARHSFTLNDVFGVAVGSVMMLMVLLISPLAGIAGLGFGIPFIVPVYVTCPNWFGHLFATAYCLAWSVLRWRMIRSNVVKYHLEASSNPLRTWISCFLAFGDGAPAVSGQRQPPLAGTAPLDDNFSVSFASDDEDDEESSNDSSSDCCEESGGASGGGGATGDW